MKVVSQISGSLHFGREGLKTEEWHDLVLFLMAARPGRLVESALERALVNVRRLNRRLLQWVQVREDNGVDLVVTVLKTGSDGFSKCFRSLVEKTC